MALALLAFGLLAPACEGGCDGGQQEEAPIPRQPAQATSAVQVTTTNIPLANAVATRGPDGQPLLVLTQVTAGGLLTVSADGEHVPFRLGQGTIGGLYRAGDRVVALESSGRHLVELAVGEGGLRAEARLDVGQSPRVFEPLPGGRKGWVLTRGEEEPLALADLEADRVVHRAVAGRTPADMVLDPKGEALYVVNFDSHDVSVLEREGRRPAVNIPVGRRPYRIFAPPDGATAEPYRLYVLHANSARITAIDTRRRLEEAQRELPAVPNTLAVSPAGRYIYALAPGAGKLLVVDATTLDARSSYDVPVGSDDVAVVGEGIGERVLVSTGERGQLQVFRAEGENLRRVAEIPIDAAAGRLAVGPGADNVWLLGPRMGRVVRFHIE